LNPGPQGIEITFIHVRSRWLPPPAGVRGFGHDLAPVVSQWPNPRHARPPSFSADALPLPKLSYGGRHSSVFSGCESDCVVVRNYTARLMKRDGSRYTQIILQSPRRNRSPRGGVGTRNIGISGAWSRSSARFYGLARTVARLTGVAPHKRAPETPLWSGASGRCDRNARRLPLAERPPPMSKRLVLENEFAHLWFHPEACIVHHQFRKFIWGEAYHTS